jgi:tetratricopeptide (TPR) repeat protein
VNDALGTIETSGERADEYAATIAVHFEQAQKAAQTAEWFGRAGEQAIQTHTPKSAAAYFQKALNFAAQTDSEISLPQISGWHKGLGIAFYSQAKFAESVEAHLKSLEIAKAVNDKLSQIRTLYLISASQFEKGETRASLESATEGVRIAREADGAGDVRLALAAVLYRQGRSNLSLGNYEEAIALGEEALKIAEEFGERGLSEKAFCFHLIAATYMFLGSFERSVFYEEQELELTRKLGNKRTEANGLNSLGEVLRMSGDGENAVVKYKEALEISREIGNKSSEILILSNMGGAMVVSSDYEKAQTCLQEVIEMIGDSEHFVLPETLQFLAEALHAQNKNAEALRAATKSLELSQKAENQAIIANAWRVLGLIAANLGKDLTINEESMNAAECFGKSLQIFSETKMEADTARTLRDFAHFEKKRGNISKSQNMMHEAKDIFTRLEMPLEIVRSHL